MSTSNNPGSDRTTNKAKEPGCLSTSLLAIDNMDGHDGLLGGRLLELSARAWEGYLNNDGARGVVLIKMTDVREVRPGSFLVPSCYAPEGGTLLVQVGLWPNEKIERALQAYDPEKDVIIIVIGFAGLASIHTVTLTDHLVPPRAWELQRRDSPIGIHLNRTANIPPNDAALLEDSGVLNLTKWFCAYQLKEKSEFEKRKLEVMSSKERQVEFVVQLYDSHQEYQQKLIARGL